MSGDYMNSNEYGRTVERSEGRVASRRGFLTAGLRFALGAAALGVASACSAPTGDDGSFGRAEITNPSNQHAGTQGGNLGAPSYGITMEELQAIPQYAEMLLKELQDLAGDTRVYFDTDSALLNDRARLRLDIFIEWMTRYPNLTFTIEGHADERGTREYNLALGDRRASAIVDYLSAGGIDIRRLTSVSYGKERPVAAGSSPEAWSKNRRGEVVFSL